MRFRKKVRIDGFPEEPGDYSSHLYGLINELARTAQPEVDTETAGGRAGADLAGKPVWHYEVLLDLGSFVARAWFERDGLSYEMAMSAPYEGPDDLADLPWQLDVQVAPTTPPKPPSSVSDTVAFVVYVWAFAVAILCLTVLDSVFWAAASASLILSVFLMVKVGRDRRIREPWEAEREQALQISIDEKLVQGFFKRVKRAIRKHESIRFVKRT